MTKERKFLWGLWALWLALIALWMVSCGDNPAALDRQSPAPPQTPLDVDITAHDPDNPQHLPDGAPVVEITSDHLELMASGTAGSDPFYFVSGTDGETVVIKRIDNGDDGG